MYFKFGDFRKIDGIRSHTSLLLSEFMNVITLVLNLLHFSFNNKIYRQKHDAGLFSLSGGLGSTKPEIVSEKTVFFSALFSILDM